MMTPAAMAAELVFFGDGTASADFVAVIAVDEEDVGDADTPAKCGVDAGKAEALPDIVTEIDSAADVKGTEDVVGDAKDNAEVATNPG